MTIDALQVSSKATTDDETFIEHRNKILTKSNRVWKLYESEPKKRREAVAATSKKRQKPRAQARGSSEELGLLGAG